MDYKKSLIKTNNIRGLILDFDGTMVPSEKIFMQTWQDVFKLEFHCPFTQAEYIKYELQDDSKLIDFLFSCDRLKAGINKDILMPEVYKNYMTQFENMLDNIDFSKMLSHIAEWKANGIKLSIVSTSRRCYLNKFFEKYKRYLGLFTCIICREDVLKLKPNPMGYVMAANKMDIAASNCLVIEDSLKGIQGAKAAGMSVVRVTENSFNIEFDSNQIPTYKSILDIRIGK